MLQKARVHLCQRGVNTERVADRLRALVADLVAPQVELCAAHAVWMRSGCIAVSEWWCGHVGERRRARREAEWERVECAEHRGQRGVNAERLADRLRALTADRVVPHVSQVELHATRSVYVVRAG